MERLDLEPDTGKLLIKHHRRSVEEMNTLKLVGKGDYSGEGRLHYVGGYRVDPKGEAKLRGSQAPAKEQVEKA